MGKARKAGAATASKKPKVVFDVKMPQYEYRQGEGKSMSVDRKRAQGKSPSLDCLANISV